MSPMYTLLFFGFREKEGLQIAYYISLCENAELRWIFVRHVIESLQQKGKTFSLNRTITRKIKWHETEIIVAEIFNMPSIFAPYMVTPIV